MDRSVKILAIKISLSINHLLTYLRMYFVHQQVQYQVKGCSLQPVTLYT